MRGANNLQKLKEGPPRRGMPGYANVQGHTAHGNGARQGGGMRRQVPTVHGNGARQGPSRRSRPAAAPTPAPDRAPNRARSQRAPRRRSTRASRAASDRHLGLVLHLWAFSFWIERSWWHH